MAFKESLRSVVMMWATAVLVIEVLCALIKRRELGLLGLGTVKVMAVVGEAGAQTGVEGNACLGEGLAALDGLLAQ